MEQYSNLNVHGRIKQKASQGTASDDVLLVSGIAPLSSTPATSTGETQTYFKGQTAVVNGATYICSDVTSSGSGSSKTWTYTWTPMSSPDNVTGPSEAVNEHVAVFDGTTGKAIKDSGFTIGKSVPSNAVFTDDHVTAVGNHYTPTKSTTKSASGGSDTNITASTNATNVVTGIEMDAAGHVTGVISKALYSTDQSVTAVGNHYTPSGGTETPASSGTDTNITNLGSGVNVVTGVVTDAAGHITGVTSKALRSVDTITTASDSGSGNLVTGVSANNGELTITKGISYGSAATGGNIVQRQPNGQITVQPTPFAGTDAASKAFVNSSINALAAYYITKNAAGDPFSTYAELMASTKVYSSGVERVPTRNDYCIVLADEENGDGDSTRYTYNSDSTTYSASNWAFQYVYNKQFTQAQMNALDSGITADKVSKLDDVEPGAQVNTVTGVKGNSESTYRTGDVNITKANIGLGSVENTALSTKVVAGTGSTSTPIYIDSSGVTKAVTSVSTSLIAAASPSSGGTGGSNGLMTAADKEKLNSIASGAEANVQADWGQTNTGADDFIKNKPFTSFGDTIGVTSGVANVKLGYSASGKNYAVAKDSSGNLYVNVPWTDQSVTAVGNHYSPSTVSGQDKTASASGATADWSIDVVKGVTLNTDGKGHVTGISVTSGKIPANPNTDAKVQQKGITTNGEYPILLKYNTGTSDVSANYVNFAKPDTVPTINPSTGDMTANGFKGILKGQTVTYTVPTTVGVGRYALASYPGTYDGTPGFVRFRLECTSSASNFEAVIDAMWSGADGTISMTNCIMGNYTDINHVYLIYPQSASVYSTSPPMITVYNNSTNSKTIKITVLESSIDLTWNTAWNSPSGGTWFSKSVDTGYSAYFDGGFAQYSFESNTSMHSLTNANTQYSLLGTTRTTSGQGSSKFQYNNGRTIYMDTTDNSLHAAKLVGDLAYSNITSNPFSVDDVTLADM